MDFDALLTTDADQTAFCTEEDSHKSLIIDILGAELTDGLAKISDDDLKKVCLIISARDWKNGKYFPADKRAVTRRMVMNPLSAITCGGPDKSSTGPMFIGKYNYAAQLPNPNLKLFAANQNYADIFRQMTNISQINHAIKVNNLTTDHAAGYLQWMLAARGEDNNNNYAARFSTMCYYDCTALKAWKFAHLFSEFKGKYFIEPTSAELNTWYNSIPKGESLTSIKDAVMVAGTWRESDRVAVAANISNYTDKVFVYKHVVKDQASWSQMVSILPFVYRSAEFHNGEAIFASADLRIEKYRILNYATFMNERVKFSFLKTYFKVLYEKSKKAGKVDWVALKHLFGWVLPLAFVPEVVRLNGKNYKVADLTSSDVSESSFVESMEQDGVAGGEFQDEPVDQTAFVSVDESMRGAKRSLATTSDQ